MRNPIQYVVARLHKSTENVADLIERREDIYNSRGPVWQSSYRGRTYRELTEILKDGLQRLEFQAEQFESLIKRSKQL